MDIQMRMVDALIRVLFLIGAVLMLCGAVLFKAESGVAVQLLGILALTISVTVLFVVYRLHGYRRADRGIATVYERGVGYGKAMARMRWGLIHAMDAFMRGDFNKSGDTLLRVSKMAHDAAHESFQIDIEIREDEGEVDS